MKVLYVYSDSPRELNCSKWDCLYPANAINNLEGNEHSAMTMYINDFTVNSPETQKIVANADIIVIERNFFEDTLTTMQFWRSRGKKFVAVFDDAYDIILPDNPSYSFWKLNQRKQQVDNVTSRIFSTFRQCHRDNDELWNNIPMDEREPLAAKVIEILKEKIPLSEKAVETVIPNITQFIWGLKMASAIQVPSEYLKMDWKKYNENTYRINNFLEIDRYMNIMPLHPHGGIIIGWQGSMSHYASFKESGVLKALQSICEKNDGVKVMIGGDRKVFDAIELPSDRKIFHNYVPEEQWPSLLKTFDIGLAPLATEYDKRRSWVKVLEYMAVKIPWVASDFPTYKDFQGLGQLTKNTPEAWESVLQDMIDNISFHKRFATGKPFEFAVSKSFANNIGKTLEIYEGIIKSPYRP